MGTGTPMSQGSGLLQLTWQIFCEKLSTSSFLSCLSWESCSCSPRRLSLASDSTSCSSFICNGDRMGTVSCARLPMSLPNADSLVPSSQRNIPVPAALSPTLLAKGTQLLPTSYLGGVGVILLWPAGFVAPGLHSVRVLGVGDAVRVGVPKIRLLHAWAS